jgi:hypothetical protein
MSSTEQFPIPILGANGEPCAGCGTPLAADQRYCLNCGRRRGGPRVAYEAYLSAKSPNGEPPASAPAPRANDVSPLGAVLGVALLGGMLLIGVLLGRGSDDPAQPQAPVVTVDSNAAPASASPDSGSPEDATASEPVASDWPSGQDGWTIELGTLQKSGTTAIDVDSTKQDLTGKGASDVGVLDSDLYASLPGGDYVFYSGVYDSRSEANAALDGLASSFADAAVVEVSDAGSSQPEAVEPTPGGTEGGKGDQAAGGAIAPSSDDLKALGD